MLEELIIYMERENEVGATLCHAQNLFQVDLELKCEKQNFAAFCRKCGSLRKAFLFKKYIFY